MFISKLPNVGTTIFTVMSKMAQEYNAINLSQGFPGFSCDEKLLNLVSKYMTQGFNQYAPMPGILPLREKIAQKTAKLYGRKINPETEICVTSGATEALFDAITAIVKQGDEVIIFEPAYDSYIPAIELSGGVPVAIELKYPDYSIDWDEVNAKLNNKTKLIIFNTPHNPTGAVWSEKDILQIEKIVEKWGVYLISDEVYEHIIFDGKIHQSINRSAALIERTFIISSFGKTYHTTGWKLGYCIAPEPLMREFKKVHQFVTFSTSTPFQFAVAEYMEDEKKYLDLPEFYQKKRDFFADLVKQTSFELLPCSGTYFQLLSYKNISDKPDTEFAEGLTKTGGVASIPISVFFAKRRDDKVLRFCFAKNENELQTAIERILKVF